MLWATVSLFHLLKKCFTIASFDFRSFSTFTLNCLKVLHRWYLTTFDLQKEKKCDQVDLWFASLFLSAITTLDYYISEQVSSSRSGELKFWSPFPTLFFQLTIVLNIHNTTELNCLLLFFSNTQTDVLFPLFTPDLERKKAFTPKHVQLLCVG